MLMAAFGVCGQYNSKGENRSRFRPGAGWYLKGVRPPDSGKVNKYDRWMVDLTYDSWLSDGDLFQAHPSSIGFAVNTLFEKPLTAKNSIALGYGLQYKLTSIRHDRELESFATFSKLGEELSGAVTGRFRCHRLAVPLELRFRSQAWRHFKWHLGGSFGYSFQAHNQLRYDFVGGKKVVKDYFIPDFNPWQGEIHVRLGIRNYGLIAGYCFTKVFQSNQSSSLNLVRMGLTISLF